MRSLYFALGQWLLNSGYAIANPTVVDHDRDVRYQGLHRNGIEVFLGIPYGEDTGGVNRFHPPKMRVAARGSTIQATTYGPACPQELGGWVVPISLSNVTEVSEDCLILNIARPKHTSAYDRLPVMVYLHGGSFWTGQNQEITISPDGMILESVENGLPVIHVAMNYRLGVFGFAQSDALKNEGSANAGLKDQRLALEWVHENIAVFGGDPNRVTIFGQSSGGLSVGMQIMAFGGTKPVRFRQAICESQALEPGITGNFTIDAMRALVERVGCNSSSLHSRDTIACLRKLDMNTLLSASLATYQSDVAHNIGDIWLPFVDGEFLPSAPSELIREGRFANVTTMIGWCDDDLTFFTDTNIKTPNDTLKFISAYAPDMTPQNVHKLLSLYPASEFIATKTLSSEFYRSARIFRDILMTCQPMWYAAHIAASGNSVYLFDWNQTILEPILAYTTNHTGFGPIHTSEFAYIFGNLSHYGTAGYPFHPLKSDYKLKNRGSRSWTTFAHIGKPELQGHDTFRGFSEAFQSKEQTYIFVVGGPDEGLSAIDGPQARPEIAKQRLRERCAFINSPEIIKQLKY